MTEITQLLGAIERGDQAAAVQLLPLLYDELRKLAAQKLANEKPGQTLQATDLVHEAYLRLVGEQHFDNRGHFFAAAAEAMRRVLVENARRKKRLKRGGDRQQLELEEGCLAIAEPREDLLALDEALGKLAEEDPAKAELVKLRYFAGLSVEEASNCLNISRATADRWWAFARAWLHDRLRDK